MDNNIKVKDANGMEFTVEVLDIFQVEGYEGKDYILYTQNEEVDPNNIKAFVSILEKDGDDFNLQRIEDEEEFKAVNKAIEEMDDDNE